MFSIIILFEGFLYPSNNINPKKELACEPEEILRQWINRIHTLGFRICILSPRFSDIIKSEPLWKWLQNNEIEYDILLPSLSFLNGDILFITYKDSSHTLLEFKKIQMEIQGSKDETIH